jgi:mannose-6-phosphate isomerase-like protein (cupin superfamily)
MRADREALVAVAKRHAQAEAEGDLATTLATLEDDPVYELATLGISFRGKAAARTYYEHFFGTFQPWIAGFELVNQWVTDEGVGEEYFLDVAPPGQPKERHRIVGILVFGATQLAGERLYASERLLRVMLGPAYEIAEVQCGRRAGSAPRVEQVARTLAEAPLLAIGASTTPEDVRNSYRAFGMLDRHGLGGRRFSGVSPWERHPFDDELLYTQEGEAEITLLMQAGPVVRVLKAGTLFVVPKGTWHRQSAPRGATIWGAANTAHDEISFEDDPRAGKP